jgi:hypothetical protein
MAVEPGTEGVTAAEPHHAEQRRDFPLAAVDVSHRLRVPISVIDSIAFGPDGASSPPHLLRLLVSTVLATDERSPICIVLPSVERVASVVSILAALECLAFDLPECRKAFLSGLSPGQRVRLYPTGEVFQIGGVTQESNGMRMISVLWLEKSTQALDPKWAPLRSVGRKS